LVQACFDFPMATISMDLRQRILKAYDRGDTTREEVSRRFEVSLGFVKSSSSSAATRATSAHGIIAADASQ
jgi:hypothetical protein